MGRFSIKRVIAVLLGIVLPLGLVVMLLVVSMRNSYLRAADSFGREFGKAMLQQGRTGGGTRYQ